MDTGAPFSPEVGTGVAVGVGAIVEVGATVGSGLDVAGTVGVELSAAVGAGVATGSVVGTGVSVTLTTVGAGFGERFTTGLRRVNGPDGALTVLVAGGVVAGSGVAVGAGELAAGVAVLFSVTVGGGAGWGVVVAVGSSGG